MVGVTAAPRVREQTTFLGIGVEDAAVGQPQATHRSPLPQTADEAEVAAVTADAVAETEAGSPATTRNATQIDHREKGVLPESALAIAVDILRRTILSVSAREH